jgi:RNA polymerase sigma-70 factor (ECF subfamily)
MEDYQQAYLTAYDMHADAIYRHCLFRVFDVELAQDLTQETFIKAWKYLADGNQVENVRALLYRIATNLVIDEKRRKRDTVPLDEVIAAGLEPGHDPRPAQAIRSEYEAALAAIDTLQPKEREAVLMRHLDDISPKEIALVQQATETSVSVRIHRALKKVRRILPH